MVEVEWSAEARYVREQLGESQDGFLGLEDLGWMTQSETLLVDDWLGDYTTHFVWGDGNLDLYLDIQCDQLDM